MQKLQTPKMQAFGAAVAIVAICAGIFFLLFRGQATSPASVVRDDTSDSSEGGAYAGDASLLTVVKKKTIAAGCKPHTESVTKDEDVASIEVLYPQICDSAFDGTVEYIVGEIQKELVAQAKKEVPEYRRVSERADAAYMLTIEPFEIFFNDSVASALLSVYIETGGAHGNYAFYTITIDRTKGSRITLDTLFSSSSGYLAFLSKRATSDLQRGLGKDALFMEGLAAKKENFSLFTLTDKAITFHFPPYQVAAYAAGAQKVTVPFADLGEYWKGGR